ncbi:MAG: hypothetical protein CME06_14955 [Gemmatimonadetes bacterium]|nr:hypothetical protein [Gemmatimonadota bacterium]
MHFECEAMLSPYPRQGSSDGCDVLVVWNDPLSGASVLARSSLSPHRAVSIRGEIPSPISPGAMLGLWVDPGVDRHGRGDRVVFHSPRILREDPTIAAFEQTWLDLSESLRGGSARFRSGNELVVLRNVVEQGSKHGIELDASAGTLVVTARGRRAGGIEVDVTPLDGTYAISALRIYKGMLHAHSSLSDGAGPPSQAFRAAKDRGVDFFAITDHAEMVRIPRFGQSRWNELREAAREATIAGEFVALYGTEYTHPTEGHLNTFGADRNIDAITAPHWDAYLEQLAAQPSAIGQFNHPYQEGTRNWNDFALPDQSIRDDALRQMALIRALDGQGRFAYAYRRALDKGWLVSPQESHDDHNPSWGDGGRSITGVLARTLTEEGILRALRERRTFATQDRGLILTLRASDETWMGGEIRSGRRDLEVVASDAVPDDTLLRIEILGRGGREIAAKVVPGAASVTWRPTVDLVIGEAVFARAVQRDGDEAVSGPLFVR